MINKENLVYWAKQLELRKLIQGTAGNISVRDPDSGVIWTTPTSLPYNIMTTDDIVGVDAHTGQKLHGYRTPTSEVPLHLGIYANKPEVLAIVHTHSLYATMFAVANRPIPPAHYGILDVGREIPVIPYARFGSEELARSVVEGLSGVTGALLQNHGSVAVGESLERAFHRAELIEWMAHLVWGASQLGDITTLTHEQLDNVIEGIAIVRARYRESS